MTINVYARGRYKEVVFHDSEDDAVYASCGYLDEDEADEFAEQLRAIARRLDRPVAKDDGQILLPFVAPRAA